MGRPEKKWDERDIGIFKNLCNVFCTEAEICSVMGVADKTLVKLINTHLFKEVRGHAQRKGETPISFKEAFDYYSAQGKASLRRMQYSLAQDGNVTMLIWLGKQHLGQSDKVDNVVVDIPVIVDDI